MAGSYENGSRRNVVWSARCIEQSQYVGQWQACGNTMNKTAVL
jgi:hypothetical protein